MFCKKCGKSMDKELTFCPRCGANQKGGPDAAQLPVNAGGGGQQTAFGNPNQTKGQNPAEVMGPGLTKSEKIAAIIKAGLFLFFAIWLFVTPALSMFRVSGFVQSAPNGYDTLGDIYILETVYGLSWQGGIGALVITVLCMVMAIAMIILGIFALLGAVKGKKRFSATMLMLSIFATILTLVYMAGSLTLRSALINEVFGVSSAELAQEGIRIGSGSIAAFVIGAVIMAAYCATEPIVSASAKAIERSRQNRPPQPVNMGYGQNYNYPPQNNFQPQPMNNYAPPPFAPPQPVKPVDVAEELIKFKKLLDDGILTQEEFDAKKKQLLG